MNNRSNKSGSRQSGRSQSTDRTMDESSGSNQGQQCPTPGQSDSTISSPEDHDEEEEE
jgi:hypothetical protein